MSTIVKTQCLYNLLFSLTCMVTGQGWAVGEAGEGWSCTWVWGGMSGATSWTRVAGILEQSLYQLEPAPPREGIHPLGHLCCLQGASPWSSIWTSWVGDPYSSYPCYCLAAFGGIFFVRKRCIVIIYYIIRTILYDVFMSVSKCSILFRSCIVFSCTRTYVSYVTCEQYEFPTWTIKFELNWIELNWKLCEIL